MTTTSTLKCPLMRWIPPPGRYLRSFEAWLVVLIPVLSLLRVLSQLIMLPFLLSLMCLTQLQPPSLCPTQTPISSHQLNRIWDTPTSSAIHNPVWPSSRTKRQVGLGLAGRKLLIAAILDPPYVTSISPHNVTGHAYQVLSTLQAALGFTFEMVQPKDGVVGVLGETGTWSGIIGMLLANEADLCLNYLSMLPERSRVLDFSPPLGQEKWKIMMRRPTETTDGNGLLAPFHTQVWWCVLGCVGGMCVVVGVRGRCKGAGRGADEGYSLAASVWFVSGAIVKQGSVLKPSADSTRLLFASWWIFVSLVTAFYTANLTAYLTLGRTPIPYDGLEAIGYRKAWVTGKEDTIAQVLQAKDPNPDNSTFYRTSAPFPEFAKLRWASSTGRGYGSFLPTLESRVERVGGQGQLLLDEQTRIEYVIYRDFRAMEKRKSEIHLRCNFLMSKASILEVPYGLGFSPQSKDVRTAMGPVLSRLTAAGLFDAWRRLDLPAKDPCNSYDRDFSERKLRTGDLLVTFLITGVGYGLGLASFICEWFWKLFGARKDVVPVPAPALGGVIDAYAHKVIKVDPARFVAHVQGDNFNYKLQPAYAPHSFLS